MVVKVKEIPNNTQGIYKLNYPNGKIYIGQSCDIKRRLWEHNNINRLETHHNSPCDLAIKKYGKFEEIEILEYVKDSELLDEREQYWIAYYDSSNKEIGYNLTIGGSRLQGENSSRAKLSNQEVLDIRRRRAAGERKKDVYKDYEKKLTFSAFEGIWLGRHYSQIGIEYLIPTNSISRQEYSSIANSGENNGMSKLTAQDVIEIRKRYDSGEKICDIAKDYPNVKYMSINRVCKRITWKNIK